MVTSGSLERKKEWLEHLKKRIFKMTLPKMTRDQNEFEAEAMMSSTLFHVKLTFTDDDENDDVDEGDDHDADDDGNGDW